jgi:hypothetical protein
MFNPLVLENYQNKGIPLAAYPPKVFFNYIRTRRMSLEDG